MKPDPDDKWLFRRCKWRCKYCQGTSFVLMDTTLMLNTKTIEDPYYYHYGDYEQGCRQRIPFQEIFKYAEIEEYDEEI